MRLDTRADHKDMQFFHKLIDQYPPLTATEENEMVKTMLKEGKETELREKLVLHNLALIPSATKKYKSFIPCEDLYMYAIEALVECSKKFDFSLNVRFNTFAYPVIWRAAAKMVKDWFNELDQRTFSLDSPVMAKEGDSDSTLIDFIYSHLSPDAPRYGQFSDSSMDCKMMLEKIDNICRGAGISKKLREISINYFIQNAGSGISLVEYWKENKITLSINYFKNNVFPKIRRAIFKYCNIMSHGKPHYLKKPVLKDFPAKPKYKDGLIWNPDTRKYSVGLVEDRAHHWDNYDYDAYWKACDEYNKIVKNLVYDRKSVQEILGV